MASINKVILLGNLTRDPQLKYLPSQTAVVEFGLAMNRRFKGANGEDREETTFVDCSAFGKTAELVNQYFHKGAPLMIEGRLKYDTWEDKQGGGKRSRLTVVAEQIHFLPRGGGQGQPGGGEYDQSQAPAPRRPQRGFQQGPPPAAPEQPFPDEDQFKPDDIPF